MPDLNTPEAAQEAIEYLRWLAQQRMDAVDSWLERQLPYVDIDIENDDFDVSVETNEDGSETLTLYKVVPLRSGKLEVKYVY